MDSRLLPPAHGRLMKFQYKHGDKPIQGYTILRGIGRGGFGEVYYARSDAGRDVALKAILHNEEIELRGVTQCINLKSPHLVSIFDVRSDETGVPFVIMEYVVGPSLREVLDANPTGLGPVLTAFVARELAKGLRCLHERGIVHRDLKPENVFFEDGYVKIGDYGLSKLIGNSRHSAQTMSVGTVHYMAPEIGSGNYDRGIDIYALGIMVYELLTGRVPIDGDSMGEILLKHLTTVPDVSAIDEPFRSAVRRALEKKPQFRQATAEAFAEEILSDPILAKAAAELEPESLSAIPARFRPSRYGGQDSASVPAVHVDPAALTIALNGDGAVVGSGRASPAMGPHAANPNRGLEAGPALAERSPPPTGPARPEEAPAWRTAKPNEAESPWDGNSVQRLLRSFISGAGRQPFPPAAFTRLFWVLVGSALLSASLACLVGLGLGSFHPYDKLGAIFAIVSCFGYAIFSFHRGLWTRTPGFWRRSLRPFLSTTAGVGAVFSFIFFLESSGKPYRSFDAQASLAFFVSFVVAYATIYALPAFWKRLDRNLERAKATNRPEDLPLPTEARFALIVAGSAAGLGAFVSGIFGILEAHRPWESYALLCFSAALLGFSTYFLRIAARGCRGRLWQTAARPFLGHAAAAIAAMALLPFAISLPRGGDDEILFLFLGGTACAMALAGAILRRYETQ